jgi:hypothetical protein
MAAPPRLLQSLAVLLFLSSVLLLAVSGGVHGTRHQLADVGGEHHRHRVAGTHTCATCSSSIRVLVVVVVLVARAFDSSVFTRVLVVGCHRAHAGIYRRDAGRGGGGGRPVSGSRTVVVRKGGGPAAVVGDTAEAAHRPCSTLARSPARGTAITGGAVLRL